MTEPEQKVCSHCKNPDEPLTTDNSQQIFRRDPEGRKVVHAVIHRKCANDWSLTNGAILIEDLEQ